MIWALLVTGLVIGLLVRLTMRTFKSGYGLSQDLFEYPQYVKTCPHCHKKLTKDYTKTLCPHCGKLTE
jgi:Zn finger protein HypA/HybF involved in hydrogenase expression